MRTQIILLLIFSNQFICFCQCSWSISSTKPWTCYKEEVTLTVNGGGENAAFSWVDATDISKKYGTGKTLTVSPSISTNYLVIRAADSVCPSAKQWFYLNVEPRNTSLTADKTGSLPPGSLVTLTANGANNYLWLYNSDLYYVSDNKRIANPLTSTTYSVIGNPLGCPDTVNVTVLISPLPDSSVFDFTRENNDNHKPVFDPVSAGCNDSLFWSYALTPVNKGGMLQEPAKVGTWEDSLCMIQYQLSVRAHNLFDSLNTVNAYLSRNQLKSDDALIPNSQQIHNFSCEQYYYHFTIKKDMGANCGVSSEFLRALLMEVLKIPDSCIVLYCCYDNSQNGDTFVLVEDAKSGMIYIVNPQYTGIWMLDGKPANLPDVVRFLLKDKKKPYSRYNKITFNDGLIAMTGGIFTKLQLYGSWNAIIPCIKEVYKTQTTIYVPANELTDSTYYLAGIHYNQTQRLYEVRYNAVKLVPEGEGDNAYQDAEGHWYRTGMSTMFKSMGKPVHFTSSLLIHHKLLYGSHKLRDSIESFFK